MTKPLKEEVPQTLKLFGRKAPDGARYSVVYLG